MTNKFKVGDKVVPINDLSGFGFPQGEVATIVDVYAHGTVRIRDEKFREATFYASTLQLAEPKPTKEQRISKLEEEVAELKSIVEQISKPSPLVSAASIIALGADEPKTANQLRAEIIEKAKGFVEKYLNACKSIFATHEGNGLLSDWGMSPKFEINSKKRAIVVLLYRTDGGNLVGKGIAKCDPSDVFNEHIGKAIALGRALGLDVSEFEQAVQPNEFTLGMVVVNKFGDEGGITFKSDGENYSLNYVEDEAPNFKIINDTNAQYEVTK